MTERRARNQSARNRLTTLAPGWLGVCLCLAAVPPATAATCESLASLTLANTTIAVAQSVPAGSFTPTGGRRLNNLPAMCRVAGSIKPSADSNIQFEVWMPLEGWNGKFQGLGGGGFAGSIDTSGMAAMVARGYAAASTDTGHSASATDGTWALDHPQKVIDFGYRAIHETAEKGKAIVAAFYGDGPKHSYFSGCSNGGRQALMEAQRYPGDYDGIVAGAPANAWTGLMAASMWQQAALQDPAKGIPAGKLPAIEAAALAACDTLDGVKDGVIDNPPACHFDPSVLLCKGNDTDACLTAPQVAMLKAIYAGPKTAKGVSIYPGYSPGGETGNGGWASWIALPAQGKTMGFTFATQFYSQMVFEKNDWDLHTFDITRDLKAAVDKVGSVLNATDADLKKFHDRGGKLLIYHGWSDAAIPPLNAVEYFESVEKKMGAKNADDVLRLFMVPGMQHCAGGPGPTVIMAPFDPQHDVRMAVERWVEEGKAPEQIIATKYKTGNNPASGVQRTRPLCAYPSVAKWNGTGSSDDAGNFACVKPVEKK
jgi:Tannase and feruloyl esterase